MGTGNIEFNYLYRDAGNYKQYGSVIFSNTDNLTITELENKISSRLIDGEFFNTSKAGIPSLFFETITDDDHDLHEFKDISLTEMPVTDSRSISEFINSL